LKYKNIQIISEDLDKTTDEVIEWLLAYKVVFERQNVDKVSDCSIHLSNENLRINNYKQKEEDTIWNRRGKLQLLPKKLRNSIYSNHLTQESFPALAFLEHQWKKDKALLGSYLEESLNNKILNLSLAKEVGIRVPNTLVSNRKKDLLDFYRLNKPIITKSMGLEPRLNSTTHFYSTPGTFMVKKEEIEFLAESFAPSLVQQYIEKKYEVRVFVTGSSFFAMAIFSQNDEQTKVDFRNYNREKPNRNVPFELPREIKNKIKSFLKKNNFKKYWNITKDQIETCKDCEFRYVCTDCRAYLKNPSSMFSKPLKCGYNPYKGIWEEWSDNPIKNKEIQSI